MFDIIKMIGNILLVIVKWLLYGTLPIILAFSIQFIYLYLFKHLRFQKSSGKKLKKISFLKRIFYLFPRQFWLDKFNKEADSFNMYGVHIIEGEQGSGKTMTLAYILNKIQHEYPKAVVKTNFGYTQEVQPINHWKDIIHSNNGIYGEVVVIDEIQNWFNSMQSRDFPPEMLTEVTQQRKQRKVIFGTSQVFSRVAKPIREQTSLLYSPITIFGCLTIVRIYKPKISADNGLADDKKYRSCFFFVHSKKLRETFDTYLKIERLSESGFLPSNEQYREHSPIIIKEK